MLFTLLSIQDELQITQITGFVLFYLYYRDGVLLSCAPLRILGSDGNVICTARPTWLFFKSSIPQSVHKADAISREKSILPIYLKEYL